MKVALVTGGAHGIGEAIVRRLRADHYAVVAVDVRPADVQADLSDPVQCRRAIEHVRQTFGRLDVLVNNAGISEFTPLADETVEHWNKVLATNLTAPFVLAQAAAPLLARAGGAIVNIASTRAVMSEAGTEAYSASKGGLVALTHALAVSLGPTVRVNCISPGWIDVAAEDLRPEDHAQHPAGRVGRPEDVAALVAWLVGPEAGFVTGAHWVMDGGMTRKMIYAE
jgi:NAD(P)-dependent dehydrogenase (short-subunit alcohol dehydrogenase family)